MDSCFLAPYDPDVACEGRMDRAHLIPKQRIKREVEVTKQYRRENNGAGLTSIIWNERAWVWSCRRHHSRFDERFFHIPRTAIPGGTEFYAAEHGLTWSLDRDFGPREQAA